MPHRFSSDGDTQHMSQEFADSSKDNMWDRTWHKVESWLKKDSEDGHDHLAELPGQICDSKERDELKKNPSRKVLPGLPRTQTFRRQNSERRDRLCPHELDADERRALSVDRRAATSYLRAMSPARHSIPPSHSAPDISILEPQERPIIPSKELSQEPISSFEEENAVSTDHHAQLPTLERASSASVKSFTEEQDRLLIQAELEAKWILNLSMHFKDRSDREKFFVTYAEEPNSWRRLTVSCDYRNPEPDSLEEDLKSLRYQRDKSARIYESIRDSLLDIQFYSTVTNLKLKTMDGRLHVHCSEDMNEIIPYPSLSMLRYLSCPMYRESDVEFVSHMSGFVYKVNIGSDILVKKEIPGPEAVDEFLYELTALASLRDAKNVIQFRGLVVDNGESVVKGLLIQLAHRGALVDLIYEARFSNSLTWSRRENWARQIVRGLSEVHEAGFVQGDFTVSNIVADDMENLWLIDMNRRGCPVGWEPPELEDMIRSGQRISMFIGVKTDLFQLGMVLWALAMCIDEPEMETRPLRQISNADVPLWFQDIVEICLSADPRERLPARDLVAMFPAAKPQSTITEDHVTESSVAKLIEPQYPVPKLTTTLDDSHPNLPDSNFKAPSQVSEISSGHTYPAGTAASSEYMFDPHDATLGRRTVRDASPVTQSDCERPRTRDESDFGSKLDLSSTFKSMSTSSALTLPYKETSLQAPGPSTNTSTNANTPTQDVDSSLSTLPADPSNTKSDKEAPRDWAQESRHLAEKSRVLLQDKSIFADPLSAQKAIEPTSSLIEPSEHRSQSTASSTSILSTPTPQTPQVSIENPIGIHHPISVDRVTTAIQDIHNDHHLETTPSAGIAQISPELSQS